MNYGKERLTQDQRMNLVLENVAEIGLLVGFLLNEGSFPKVDLDLSSEDVSQAIIKWAKEFEEKYEGPEFDFSNGVPELGNPEGYLDAIDNFTEVKMRDQGWLTAEYLSAKERFWNKENLRWTCPNECEVSYVLVCGGDLGNPDSPNHYFQMLTDGTYTNRFTDGTVEVPAECHEHADAGCGSEPICPECRSVCVKEKIYSIVSSN